MSSDRNHATLITQRSAMECSILIIKSKSFLRMYFTRENLLNGLFIFRDLELKCEVIVHNLTKPTLFIHLILMKPNLKRRKEFTHFWHRSSNTYTTRNWYGRWELSGQHYPYLVFHASRSEISKFSISLLHCPYKFIATPNSQRRPKIGQ